MKTPEYQKGYYDGFMEGQSRAFQIMEKQLTLAYLSRPIVIQVSKEGLTSKGDEIWKQIKKK